MDPHSQNVDSEDYDGDEDEVEEPTATPLWKYVIKVLGEGSNAKPGVGGPMKFICNFGCETVAYTGSYSRTTGKSSVKALVDKMFQIASREEVDQKIARCIYDNGIAFNADMLSSILNAPKGYKSPNYEKVRTALLDKE
ncbi:hypothetical protein ACSBR2_007906 [Camellia fascicularis]